MGPGLLRLHPDSTVKPNHFAVEHLIINNMLD